MGSVKEYYFDLQEEAVVEWIKERLGDHQADENTEGWNEACDEYNDLQDHLATQAYYDRK